MKRTSCPKASNGQRFPCPALYWPRTSFGKQGSGPDRGQSPVEWRDFVRTSVCPYVHLSPSLGHPAKPEAQPASQPARTDVRTENLPILQDFVPYRGRCPASQRKIYANKEKQGKGIADHLMPLGDWFKALGVAHPQDSAPGPSFKR